MDDPAGRLMRILGLDVGDRRIGVALSDPIGLTAQPVTTVERRNPSGDVDAIKALVERHGVGLVVVGLPLTLRGEQGPQARKVVAFAERIRQRLAIPVQLLDERLTTIQGTRSLLETGTSSRKRKQVIDQVAAQLILQQFLDTHRSQEG
jgi:putative Holliday junction resolvase